jgi:hypothetical protein
MPVRTISQDELDKFGIDETTGRLYFDGKEVVTRTELSFSAATTFWAGVVVSAAGVSAVAASVTALVNVIRLLMGK